MPASDHHEYATESVYLQRTLRAVDRQIGLLENLGWSGAGNPRATVVIDVDERHYTTTQYDAKLLYIGVSRALHQLFIVWAGRPSPLLSEVVITR
jgi:hypothetical protein